MSLNQHSRTFIRHPVDMPIDVEPADGAPHREGLKNLSLGGVSFASDEPWSPGTFVKIRISCCSPPATVTGQITWCERTGERYEVGVCFHNSADAYRIRMVEQACHIQQYRLDQVIQQGRYLTLDEAAREWIEHYAPHFAPADDWPSFNE